MASKSLRRLRLPETIVDRLAAGNIKTCKDVLVQSPLDLLCLARCSYSEVQDLIHTCCEAVSPACFTGIALKDTQNMPNGRFLSTSLPGLDEVLHGGFPAGNISEVTGPAGSGKTQFCMMISALASSSVQEKAAGSVLYFDTEGAFSACRLMEMVQSRWTDLTKNEAEDIVRRVLLIPILSCTELMNRMESLEEKIITTGARLVIVDSVASLIRREFTAHQSFYERTDFITRLAAILKSTAQFFRIPVVTTNQITTKFCGNARLAVSEESSKLSEADHENHGYLTAALGNTWSHSVNTRLILQFVKEDTRQILVAKSPVSPFVAVGYTIQASGLCQRDGSTVTYEGTDPGEQRIRSKAAVPIASSHWTNT